MVICFLIHLSLDRKFLGGRNCLYCKYEQFSTIMDLSSRFIIRIGYCSNHAHTLKSSCQSFKNSQLLTTMESSNISPQKMPVPSCMEFTLQIYFVQCHIPILISFKRDASLQKQLSIFFNQQACKAPASDLKFRLNTILFILQHLKIDLQIKLSQLGMRTP